MRKSLFLLTGLLMVASPALAHAEYCREFTRPITIGGRTQEGIGLACRQPDGSWRIKSEAEDMGYEPQPEPEVVYVEKEVPVYVERPQSYFEFSFGDFHRHHRGWGHRGGWGHDGGWRHGHHWR